MPVIPPAPPGGTDAASIGPVSVSMYDLTASWTSQSNTKGFRGAKFSGTIGLYQAYALSEMMANPDLRQTIGGVTGVLEYFSSPSTIISNFNGYYLFLTFEMSPDGFDADFWPYSAFSLDGVLVGDLS